MHDDKKQAYASDLKRIGSAIGGLFTRAKEDITPVATDLMEVARPKMDWVQRTLLRRVTSVFVTPTDPWVQAIPLLERTPERLLAHPEAVLEVEDGNGILANHAQCVAWIDVKGASDGQPVVVSILRLKTRLDDQGHVLPHTPVLTLETLPPLPSKAPIHAAIAAGVARVLTAHTPVDRQIVIVGSRSVLERAKQIKSDWIRTPGSQDWAAFDAAVRTSNADIRWLSRTSKDFPAVWFAKTPVDPNA